MKHRSSVTLVTGASGFVGIHCVKQLLGDGYRVRATVRDPNDTKKCDPIRALDKSSDPGRLEIVGLELQSEQKVWDRAVSGCHFVLHVASPVNNSRKASERHKIIQPAIDGTRNMLEASKRADTVRRVVMTSSIAAIGSSSKLKENRNRCTFTEEDWRNLTDDNIGAYGESKIRAERFAWDFVRNENVSFDLVTICPGSILGPMLSSAGTAREEFVTNAMNGKMLPRLAMAVVDVRDVARAHLLALTKHQAGGNRIILVTEHLSTLEITECLSLEFKPKGYRIQTEPTPRSIMEFAAHFSELAAVLNCWQDFEPTYDNSKMRSVLGMTDTIAARRSIIEMGYSLIEHGFVSKIAGIDH